jgi:hypothetical protein
MSTAVEYRALADQCFQWAREAATENVRLVYLDIANGWLELAAHGGLPTRQPQTDPKHPVPTRQ